MSLGQALGRCLVGGMTVGLIGPLGAGKTQLVKGIALGNALDDQCRVTSPTFTLVHEYRGRLTLIHIDAYRLAGGAELLTLGFDEMIRPGAAVVVEWADRVRPVMPEDTLWVDITPTGDTVRSVRMSATGVRDGSFLDALRKACD